AGEHVAHRSLDARLRRRVLGRRAETVYDLEARDDLTQLALALSSCIVGNDDDQVDVGDTREAALGHAAEEEHAHQRMPALRAGLDDRVEIGLDAERKLKAGHHITSMSE